MAKQKIDPQYVDQLIQYIGGRENISTVTHCITRSTLCFKRRKQKLIPQALNPCQW